MMPPAQLEMVPPGTVDIVLTFRSIHNWMPRGYAETMFEEIYAVLKPGGILGEGTSVVRVVEQRLAARDGEQRPGPEA